MRVLLSWGTDEDGGILGCGGSPRMADILARDGSYDNLRTPLHKAVVGGCPLAVELLLIRIDVCACSWRVIAKCRAIARVDDTRRRNPSFERRRCGEQRRRSRMPSRLHQRTRRVMTVGAVTRRCGRTPFASRSRRPSRMRRPWNGDDDGRYRSSR